LAFISRTLGKRFTRAQLEEQELPLGRVRGIAP